MPSSAERAQISMNNEPASKAQQQLEVEKFWNAKPCDSDTTTEAKYSFAYFRDIERERYRLQSHILDLLSSLELDGKKVLEIGTGVGTDARTIIALGGQYTGINVDAGSSDMTRRALAVFDLPGEVRQATALDIPYPDGTFDVVYSFGVLHHIPEISSAIQEIHRVIKPGGCVAVMLYNRTSINYAVEIRHLRKWGINLLSFPGVVPILGLMGLPQAKLQRHLELKKTGRLMSDEEWLSRNTDGPDNPYSRVYSLRETEELLSCFTDIDQKVDFFDYRHWGLLGKLMPPAVRRFIAHRWGWHRIVTARKQLAH